jgi:transposase
VWLDKHGLHCIWFKMDNSFSTMLKHIKHPKEVETMNQYVHWDKKLMLVQHNTRPHTGAATSAVIDSIGFADIRHRPYSPDLAPCDF